MICLHLQIFVVRGPFVSGKVRNSNVDKLGTYCRNQRTIGVRMIREGFSEEVISEQRPGEKENG